MSPDWRWRGPFVLNSAVCSADFLFGRGPNRVMETACFDANVQ